MKAKITPENAEGLRQLDLHLNTLWQLGRNSVLAWTPRRNGLLLLVLPVHDVLACVSEQPTLLLGSRFMDEGRFREVVAAVGVQPVEMITALRVGLLNVEVPWQTVERVIRRYSINETACRAVLLFDIVGFSKCTSIQQIGQLNALEYSINVAHQRLKARGVDLDVARSTTGDGFYVWNRRTGLTADMIMLILLILVLAENDVARSRDRFGLTPLLRTTFSVGRHYAYYQIDGLTPRGYDYIVGDVTIEVARLIAETAPGQILIGDFERPVRDDGPERVGTVEFVGRAEKLMRRLSGVEVDGQKITEIKLGVHDPNDQILARVRIRDKHGMSHFAYNALAEVHRGGHIPVLLGIGLDQIENAPKPKAKTAAVDPSRSAERGPADWPGFTT
ncbi:MAG: hypothetical protein GC191_20450 [Azospirillum sp.]|nr:hypothetical protein [Azospirillum sp.]